MNENKKNTMNNIFRACLLMQSTLHRLENIQGEVPFVRENKARLNNTIKWLESIVCELTENLSITEANEYIQLIASIDNFAEQIELEF